MPILITLNLNRPYIFVRLRSTFTSFQYSLKIIHVLLITLRGCSILTQRFSLVLNHIQGVFICTQRLSCTHIGIQRVFTLTERCSCVSNCIQRVFKAVHIHSKTLMCILLHLRGFQSIHAHFVISKNNRSIKAFGNSLNFLHQLPCSVNSMFFSYNSMWHKQYYFCLKQYK